jgi:hypothetical protein
MEKKRNKYRLLHVIFLKKYSDVVKGDGRITLRWILEVQLLRMKVACNLLKIVNNDNLWY